MYIKYIIVPAQADGGAVFIRGTAQWFRLANLARIFVNFNWYDYSYNIIVSNINSL